MISNKELWQMRLIGTILVLMLTVTVGCGRDIGNGTEPEENQGETQDEIRSGNQVEGSGTDDEGGETAMGRYVGTETDIGDLLGSRLVDMKEMDDGSIMIQDYNGARIVSHDKGETWEEVPLRGLNELLHDKYVTEMALAKDGSTAICFISEDSFDYNINTSDNDQTDASVNDNRSKEEASGDSGVTDMAEGHEDTGILPELDYQYIIIDSAGNEIPFEIDGEDNTSSFLAMQFAEDGELYLQKRDMIYHLDKETGKAKVYLNCPGYVESFSVGSGRMLFMIEGRFVIYDMTTDKWTEEETVNHFLAEAGDISSLYSSDEDNSVSMLPFMATEDIMYLAFSQGLFRHAIGGSRVEQVINGSLSKFSDAAVAIIRVLALENNEFLALFTDGKVVRYAYHPDIPSVPDKQLRVYSLEKDTYIQQAITLYQGANPSVFVKYETGMNDGIVTREDALKKLNTEIMAGFGPDLIILDHMPIRSYMKKGVLDDLTPYLNAVDDSSAAGTLWEGLIPTVKNTFEQDGKIMALPIQFTVPMIVGPKELVENIPDLASFADAVEAYRSTDAETQILGMSTDNAVLQYLSIGSAHAWQKADGSVNEGAIREFLTQASRINDLDYKTVIDSEMDPDNMENWTGSQIELYKLSKLGIAADVRLNIGGKSISLDEFKILEGGIKIVLGNIVSSQEMVLTSSVMNTVGDEIMIEAMPGTSDKVYLPMTIVSINAASPNKELAGDMLRALISEETMSYSESAYPNGFPVNRAAYNARFLESLEKVPEGVYIRARDGVEIDMYPAWPEEEWITHFRGIMESADTPDLTEKIVKDVVFEEGVDALNGTKTVDEAVAAIMNRISIYVAE